MRAFLAVIAFCCAGSAHGKTVFGVKPIQGYFTGPTFVGGLNNRSVVVGAYDSGFEGAAFYEAGGKVTTLPGLPSNISCVGALDDCFPVPTGVTRNGTVVGFFSGQILQTQAPYVDIFTWQPGAASLSNIVTIGPADCGIGCLLRPFLNNSDMIAFTGFGDTATNSNKVFFGPAGGTVQQISGLASDAVATGLTNENLVVGTETSGTASPISVFFNFRHGVVTLHRPPGSRYVGNVTANDKGLVAGSYQGTDGTAHIFTWQAGRYTVLPLPPGISDISVYAMNNKGRLVGICLDALDGLQHLFLHNGTEFTLIPQGQLPYLGHYSIFRLLINDENVIVYSFYGDYNDFGSYRILCAGTGC